MEVFELYLLYSEMWQDNIIALKNYKPPDSSYNISFANGYVYASNNDNGQRLALDLYYNDAKNNHATVALNVCILVFYFLFPFFFACLGFFVISVRVYACVLSACRSKHNKKMQKMGVICISLTCFILPQSGIYVIFFLFLVSIKQAQSVYIFFCFRCVVFFL